MSEPEEQGICCETVSSNNVRNCAHKASPTKLPKHETKENSNKRAKVEEEKVTRTQAYTEDYRQVRKAEHGRHSLPQGGAHRLVTQHQTISPENTHAGSIIQMEPAKFRKILVFTYAPTVKREVEEQSGYMKGFGGQKGG